MTSKKITKNEFEKWGEEIWDISEEALRSYSDETPEQKVKSQEIISIYCVQIWGGNTFSLEIFLKTFAAQFDKLPKNIREKKFNFPYEDGVKKESAGKEWINYLYERAEEHHRTRIGKVLTTQDFPLIAERINKIKKWNQDKEEREELLSKIYRDDKEGYDLVWRIVNLTEKLKDVGVTFNPDNEIMEEDVKENPYLLEDFSQVIFRAKEAINKEKEKLKKAPEPEKKKEEKKHQIKSLEEEMEELKRQNKDLKRRISEASTNPDKKALLEADLKSNEKALERVQQRIDNLQKELKDIDGDSGNGKKMNLAIGLGIFAAVVAVICLIIVLARRPRHRDY